MSEVVTALQVEWFQRDPGGTTVYIAPETETDTPDEPADRASE